MWSKIFNTHSKSFGWNNEDYWEGHHTEPYNEYWANPEKMEGLIFPEEYNVTSISCPYWRDVTPQVPMYKEFIQNCQQLGVNVTVCVLSRDRNIIERQQKRVRGESTMQTFISFIGTSFCPLYKFFISANNTIRYIDRCIFFIKAIKSFTSKIKFSHFCPYFA